MTDQVNISSKQAIMNLFLMKKCNCIDITEIFLLQDYINKKNNGNIHMDISFDDIKRTVQYYDELFVMAGYRILLREGKNECIENNIKLPKKISNLIEDYVKNPSFL